MPDNPATLLRQAAEKLRGHATAPGITPPPWVSLDGGDRIIRQPGIDDLDYVVDEPTSNAANAAWIALMHPGVGAALADWLGSLTGIEINEHAAMPDEFKHALAVARQILGVTE